jgi:hypothetical protein
MKAYLDNDIVSAIGKRDVSSVEIKILQDLLNLCEAKKVELVTSRVTAREISRYKGGKKGAIEAVYDSLAKVPFIEDHEVLGFHSSWDPFGGISHPLVEDDKISSTLRRMGLKAMDAHHVMVAVRAGCHRFVAYDGGIRHRSKQMERAFGIKALTPAEMVEEVK